LAELGTQSAEFRAASFELKGQKFELRAASFELKGEMTELKAQIAKLATPSFTASCFVFGCFRPPVWLL
jgi:hypothetical protein